MLRGCSFLGMKRYPTYMICFFFGRRARGVVVAVMVASPSPFARRLHASVNPSIFQNCINPSASIQNLSQYQHHAMNTNNSNARQDGEGSNQQGAFINPSVLNNLTIPSVPTQNLSQHEHHAVSTDNSIANQAGEGSNQQRPVNQGVGPSADITEVAPLRGSAHSHLPG